MARRHGVKLRQSFVRTVPKLLVAQRGRGAEEERREHARWLGALRRSPGGGEETACRITPGKLGPAQGGNGQENPEPKALRQRENLLPARTGGLLRVQGQGAQKV